MNIKNNKNCKVTINDEEVEKYTIKPEMADKMFEKLGYKKYDALQSCRYVRYCDIVNGEKETLQSFPYGTILTQTAIDEVESLLSEFGYAVINSDSVYPEYLENSNGLKRFYELANEGEKSEQSVALVSDAGMPTISDPGFNLIEEARNQKINFVVIPGVSATTTAICASNLGPEFTFLGFGKAKKNQLISQISSLKEGTYILFSAPHKIEFLLDIINKNIEDHSLFVGRELTKTFESYYWGNAKEIKEQLHNNLRGEMTLVLKINKSKKQKENKYKKSL